MQDLMARHIDLAFRGGDSTPLMQGGRHEGLCGERRRRHATKPRDELSAFYHSIT
jgi:hypothetical protein